MLLKSFIGSIDITRNSSTFYIDFFMQENYSEYQVGNWVIYLPEGKYCTIQSLSPYPVLQGALHIHPCTIQDIKAIDITADKLQVCGFEVDYPWFGKNIHPELFVALHFTHYGEYTLYNCMEEFCRVKYIHEVQNAYHAITGELLKGNLWGVREG